MENEDANWTKRTTQETYEYCSGIYSTIHINQSVVIIVYIGKQFESIRDGFESIHWMWVYVTDDLTHGVSINNGVQHINSQMSNEFNQSVTAS